MTSPIDLELPVYPLYFRYRDPILGNGFVAQVEVQGRVLCTQDPEDGALWWMVGVEPGAIVASGAERSSAHDEFRRVFLTALFDIAEESGTFEEFRAGVEAFFYQTNGPAAVEWEDAVCYVRTHALASQVDCVVVRADTQQSQISVSELAVTPQQNVLATYDLRIAA